MRDLPREDVCVRPRVRRSTTGSGRGALGPRTITMEPIAAQTISTKTTRLSMV